MILNIPQVVLLIAVAVCGKINVVKLACDVKIAEVPFSPEMVPAKATSGNLAQLILALNICNIERAQVAGWNDHVGNYILYSNGALVPEGALDIPKEALFFDSCNCDTQRVLCVVNPDDPHHRRCYLPFGTLSDRSLSSWASSNPGIVHHSPPNPGTCQHLAAKQANAPSEPGGWHSSAASPVHRSAHPCQEPVHTGLPGVPCNNPPAACHSSHPSPKSEACNIIRISLCKRFVYSISPRMCQPASFLSVYFYTTGVWKRSDLSLWRKKHPCSLVGYPEELCKIKEKLNKIMHMCVDLFFDSKYDLLVYVNRSMYTVDSSSGELCVRKLPVNSARTLSNLTKIDFLL